MVRVLRITNRFAILTGSLLFGIALAASPVPRSNAPQTTTQNNKTAKDTTQPAVTPADRQLTKQIQSDLMNDKTLSSQAHNIRVTTRQGKVTLRGTVQSDDNKADAESIAKKAAGDGDVVNELRVRPAPKK